MKYLFIFMIIAWWFYYLGITIANTFDEIHCNQLRKYSQLERQSTGNKDPIIQMKYNKECSL